MQGASSIPMHSLNDRTDIGLDVQRMDISRSEEITAIGTHRDDHYIFLFLERGSIRMMIDFQEFSFEGCTAACLLPGQVHNFIASDLAPVGWMMATDLGSVDDSLSEALEDFSLNPGPVAVSNDMAEILVNELSLLRDMVYGKNRMSFSKAVVNAMVQVCAGTFSSIFQQNRHHGGSEKSRPVIITNRFKSLVLRHFKTVKSPAEYAGMLHITPSYLNEAVKNITGFTATHWIQRAVILESKRLLYHTNLNVKEISFEVGYSDPTYFSRLFQKIERLSPAAFRKEYRK